MKSGVSLHFTKHRADTGVINGLQRHNERQEPAKHGNDKIRVDESNKNIVLVGGDGSKLSDRVDKRIEEGYKGSRAIRKDAIRMVEVSVTPSGDMTEQPEKVQEQYLRDSYDWLCKKFGAENVVSAAIHKDETTMHLHLDFVPLTEEGRLNANQIIMKKTTLHKAQDDFLKWSQKENPSLGFKRGSETKGLRMKEFKRLKAAEDETKEDVDNYKASAMADVEEARVVAKQMADEAWKNYNNAEQQKKDNDAEKEKNDAEYARKTKELSNRENGLNTREKNLDTRENNIIGKEALLDVKETDVTNRENAVSTREDNATSRENAVKKREDDVEKRESKLTEIYNKIQHVVDKIAKMPMAMANRTKSTFKKYNPISKEENATQLVNELEQQGVLDDFDKSLENIQNKPQGPQR